MTDLSDIIARLEKASGPDRRLDAQIECELRRLKAYEIGLNDEQRSHWKPLGDLGEVIDDQGYTRYHAPEYSRSIDDALTLVPENFSYELTQSAVEPPRLARARLWDWRRSPTAFDPGNEWKSEGNRPLPIALCIAALKARQALRP